MITIDLTRKITDKYIMTLLFETELLKGAHVLRPPAYDNIIVIIITIIIIVIIIVIIVTVTTSATASTVWNCNQA